MGILDEIFGSRAGQEVDPVLKAYEAERRRIERAGSVDGSHYTGYVEQVRQLKRENRHEKAIELLLRLVGATEAEARTAGRMWGVAPWYYEQLAIVYRKERRYAEEVAILERYHAQSHAPGVGPTKLAERLTKAQMLLRKQENGSG